MAAWHEKAARPLASPSLGGGPLSAVSYAMRRVALLVPRVGLVGRVLRVEGLAQHGEPCCSEFVCDVPVVASAFVCDEPDVYCFGEVGAQLGREGADGVRDAVDVEVRCGHVASGVDGAASCGVTRASAAPWSGGNASNGGKARSAGCAVGGIPRSMVVAGTEWGRYRALALAAGLLCMVLVAVFLVEPPALLASPFASDVTEWTYDGASTVTYVGDIGADYAAAGDTVSVGDDIRMVCGEGAIPSSDETVTSGNLHAFTLANTNVTEAGVDDASDGYATAFGCYLHDMSLPDVLYVPDNMWTWGTAYPSGSGTTSTTTTTTTTTTSTVQTVALSQADADRLDLTWYGIWFAVGVSLIALIAPEYKRFVSWFKTHE